MTREQIHDEMRDLFGLVPTMFQTIPDASLEAEWRVFKAVQLTAGFIPNKYRELMGVALSAVAKCRYCSFYHTEMARLNGATDDEIEEAVHYAKSSAGWSAYLNGMQVDFDLFRREILQACEHVRLKAKS